MLKKYVFFVSLLWVNILIAQQNLDGQIDKLLFNYTNENVSEKVFLHLDKPYYAAGERIWFKAYLVDGIFHKADSLSAVLYVDVLKNGDDKIVNSGRFRLDGGLGHGELLLPDSIANGLYTIRAYTNWMRNFSMDFFYKQTFEVIGGKVSPSPQNIVNTFDFDFQLMPESGYWVDGIQTKVAFKAIDNNGKGIDVSGFILMNDKDTIGKISSEHLGMGFFRIRPKLGAKYTVEVTDNYNRLRKKVELPKTEEFGAVLTIDNFESKDYINLSIRTKYPTYGKPMKIVAQSRGLVAYTGNFQSSDVKTVQNVPRNLLSDGIVHFTLFDESNNPICERLVFNTQPKSFNVKLISNKPSFSKREKTTLEFEITDDNGKPIDESFFSLAVTDASQVLQGKNQENIYTYFFLGSDLKGQVEQPAYYFDSKNEKAQKHLDLLMMTQGWTRFQWREVFSNNKKDFAYYPEVGINISGKALKSNKKALKEAIHITGLLRNEETRQSIMNDTELNGKFDIYGLNFQDSADLVLTAWKNEDEKEYITQLEFPERQKGEFIKRSPVFSFQKEEEVAKEYIDNAKFSIALEKNVFYTELKTLDVKAKKEQKVDNRRPYGDKVYKSLDYRKMGGVGGLSVLESMQSRLPGIEIKCNYTGKNCQVRVRGNVSMNGNNEPLYLLDGVPVEQFVIQAMPLHEIERVDVLTGASAIIYGPRAAAGVINVLTRSGSTQDPSEIETPFAKIHRVMGYNKVKEFYTPKYNEPNPPADHDARATIFWSPMIKVTKGWSRVEFFNSDETTEVHCLMQGMDGKGKVGIGSLIYKVK